jgi:CRISPR-associated endonuclease/helicase Cas3
MREVIAVCRSRKGARDRVATVLDRYFWRIGDRTWRGKASNACLDRVARELRSTASRATAVSIQEVRSSTESRMPMICVGSMSSFSEEGLAPVASHPSAAARIHGTPVEQNGLAAVRIAALFHDLGKAMVLFQEMLSAYRPDASASFVRHELFSAVVWDLLFGSLDDEKLKEAIAAVTPQAIDVACRDAIDWLLRDGSPQDMRLPFGFLQDETRITFAIGMLILTHHRLPEGETDHLGIRGGRHAQPMIPNAREKLEIAPGTPFWHDDWWLRRLRKDAGNIVPEVRVEGLDILLRGSLMIADHVGSSQKEPSRTRPEILANTLDVDGERLPADSLSTHVRRVYLSCRPAFDVLHRLRDRMPALAEAQMPMTLAHPEIGDPRFSWQMEAARAARSLAGAREGGFFACLLSGTGTGKTRGAPTILAGAAFGDSRPERRYFRMTLGLGLRVLASQSAKEYVADLALQQEDVRVMIGKPVIEFGGAGDVKEDQSGSESLTSIPEWLRIEQAEGPVPEFGAPGEADWIRGLSLDTDRGIPAILQHLAGSSRQGSRLAALALAPIVVATVDHLMGVAAPVKSAFIPAMVRTATSDLILDEIDQYGPEDLAAIARLVFQAASAGHRVIIMSATLTQDVGQALHNAYRSGWSRHARTTGVSDHVNILLTGDAPGSTLTNAEEEGFADLYAACRDRVLEALATAPARRIGEILDPVDRWSDLVAQVHAGCSQMHRTTGSDIEGFKVSVGLVRMTRISHTSALFTQLPAGAVGGRLRVKVCLHSNFPLLHRSWVEDRLKRALTRKNRDPQEGLRDLCHTEGLLERASRLGVRDIEIVCVTSPVIETGNDLDFDYAILDPISLRSIVQTAGRVRRHREGEWRHPNVLILGRSPIALQDGRLAMPGVETEMPHETGVSRGNLNSFQGRLFRDLAGDVTFSRIDASPLLREDQACPLRDTEARLRADMMNNGEGNAPLGRYLRRSVARMNARFTETRRFRRSTTANLTYAFSGEDLSDGRWLVNIAEYQKKPVWRTPGELHEEFPPQDQAGFLFTNILEHAWIDRSGFGAPISDEVMRRLVSVDIPDYRRTGTTLPVLSFSEQTGFTRGCPEDLLGDFGKSK